MPALTIEADDIIHPRLRRLSTSRGNHPQHCSKCHLRLPSLERLPALIRRESASSEEEWDGFCPDITMPTDLSPSPSRRSLQRQHSVLCTKNVPHHEGKGIGGSPIQMLAKEHAADLGRHRDKCNC